IVAGGGIGREADGGLVAQRVVRQDRAVLDDLEERQHEIARDAEELARAVGLQGVEERGGNRRLWINTPQREALGGSLACHDVEPCPVESRKRFTLPELMRPDDARTKMFTTSALAQPRCRTPARRYRKWVQSSRD